MSTSMVSPVPAPPLVYIEIINYLLPRINELAEAHKSMEVHHHHLFLLAFQGAELRDWSHHESTAQTSSPIENPIGHLRNPRIEDYTLHLTKPQALLLSALAVVDYASKMLLESIKTSEEAAMAVERVEALWKREDSMFESVTMTRHYRLDGILLRENGVQYGDEGVRD